MNPKLVHPVTVIYQNLNTSAFNPIFKEIEGEDTYLDPITIKAQVKYSQFEKMDFNVTGYELKGDGYLLVHKEDGALIEKKAKISQIGNDNVEFYVSDKTPVSVYLISRFLKVFFKNLQKGTP